MSREQADQVALAVDNPRKPTFPWPFADRTPSYVPRKFTPAPIPEDQEVPTVWSKGEGPDFWDGLTPYIVAAIITLGCVAFAAAALIRW